MTTKSEPGPDGLLLVDKPAGPTSHDVVRWVRKALRTRAVGHAGTLDPFATGLLACACGRATRLLRFFTESEKTYEGVIRLGVATDSGDLTGAPLGDPRNPGDASERAASVAAAALTGAILQVPPMHSAKKRDGVPLHELARRGEIVERAPVPVRVSWLRVAPLDRERVSFEVRCSAGTYVRVLAADLGELLGCGAHLESLRRTRSGELRVEDAVPASELSELAARRLIPLDAIPLPLPSLACIDEGAIARFAHGAGTPRSAWAGEGGDRVACRTASGALLGIARATAERVEPDVVLVGAAAP